LRSVGLAKSTIHHHLVQLRAALLNYHEAKPLFRQQSRFHE
jgi:hypothetical protein